LADLVSINRMLLEEMKLRQRESSTTIGLPEPDAAARGKPHPQDPGR